MDDLANQLAAALGDQYAIERELHPGGMARVFVAVDRALNRRVAVKVLAPSALSHGSTERFLREIQLVAALQHPNIVGILGTGRVGELPYFVMPFIDGASLRVRIERDGAISPAEAVEIIRDVTRALAYAHGQGVTHRDIKPDNILLSNGVAVVSDFGVAKAALASSGASAGGPVTQTGMSIGTPAYMAPEQIAADPTVDGRADLYALGVVAYEMLAGRHPFDHRTPQQLILAHLSETPTPLTGTPQRIPEGLSDVVHRCLAKDREDRWSSAQVLLDQLSGLTSDITRARSLPRVPAVVAKPGVRRATLAFAALALLVLVGGGLWWRTARHTPPAQPARSLLIVPFDAIGSDTSAAFLAEALAQELVGAATRIRGLRVASPSGSAAMARFTDDSALAAAVHVSYLLKGSVRRSGDHMRVSAQLIDPVAHVTLWADTYDRGVREVVSLEDDLTRAIGVALSHTLGDSAGVDAIAGASRGTSSAEAYDDFLRARFFFQRRGAASLARASELLNDAVRRDPKFARAYALLAQVRSVEPLYASGGADAALAAGLQAATQAIALDSTIAAAWAARANLLNSAYRWTEAERDYRRAVHLDPENAEVHAWLGEHLLVRGQLNNAVDELRRAADLDPLSPVTQASYALALGIAGQTPAARTVAARAVDLDSLLFVTRLMAGCIELFDHRAALAVTHLERANQLAPGLPTVLGMLGVAYVDAGDRRRAQDIASTLTAMKDADALVGLAHIQIALGDTRGAITSLEAAVARHAPQLAAESMSEPVFDAIRSDPRYAALVKGMGLDVALFTGTTRRR